MKPNSTQELHISQFCKTGRCDRSGCRVFASALRHAALYLLLLATCVSGQESIADLPAELIIKAKPRVMAKGRQAELHDVIENVLGRGIPFELHAVSILAEGTPLANAFTLRLEHPGQLRLVLEQLQSSADIQYVQFNHRFPVHAIVPDDSLFPAQWGLETIRAPEAWEITTGAQEIPVAVIDTGIDYRHPDLQGQIWINDAEDVNHNGQLDSMDINLIDDDGNGFVDDVAGWDFTDTAIFIDNGDHTRRDNDPMDENGHGTAIAGIIGARTNNRIGVAGVAFGSKIMNLRAGTSFGFLEEDDVAAAIVYAVRNGARVINMSFGDVVVSPMLRDVVRWAHAQGAVLVASSGNSASDTPHYPSGFAETISVGAITDALRQASFSNFGITLDLVAPGHEIWTTSLGGEYSRFSGTSVAAPFVSAAAALLLSQQPASSPEIVRMRLTAAARDLGESYWDARFGAGLLDARAALDISQHSVANLLSPQMDSGLAGGKLAIIGTASGAFLDSYSLSYGTGNNPDAWNPIALVRGRQVIEDTLAVWSLANLPDTTYALQLRINNKDGSRSEDKIRIVIDRTPPVISDLEILPMIDGDSHSALVIFRSDDTGSGFLHWRQAGSTDPFATITLNYISNEQRFNFQEMHSAGAPVEFFVSMRNVSGLETTDDNHGAFYRIDFPEPIVPILQLNEMPTGLPGGLLFNRLVDMDENGRKEVLMSMYSEQAIIGPMAIYEWTPEGFAEKFITPQRAIPRDVGDGDGDNLVEILVGLGPASAIYEAAAPGTLPDRPVWQDTAGFWASRFADMDDDQQIEIIGRVRDMWQIRENAGDNRYLLVDSLPNPTAGSNATGVPHAELGDFDGDGRREILLGDYDGDIYIYENFANDRYRMTWSDRLPLLDTVDFIRAGDFTGDGRLDFAVACHSDPALNSEHEFDSRHWLVRIYTADDNDMYKVIWQQRFFGFFHPKDFDAGLGAGDLDGNGTSELYLSLFPDFYVIEYREARSAFVTTWYLREGRSNTAIVGDPGDGKSSIFFNDGAKIARFALAENQSSLPAPVSLQAFALDAGSVQLRWRQVTGAERYRVYRKQGGAPFAAVALVSTTEFLDRSVNADVEYAYAVTAVRTGEPVVESPLSRVVRVTPGPGPALIGASFVRPAHVNLLFSEPLGDSAKNLTHYRILGQGAPLSAVLAAGGREVLLAVPALRPGEYRLLIANLYDSAGTPMQPDSIQVNFRVPEADMKFYLVSSDVLSERAIRLRFNLAVDPLMASDTSHFRASRPLRIASAQVDAEDPAAVILQLDQKSRIAPLGREYRVTISGLKSASGIQITEGLGDAAGFVLASERLERIFAYPNPFVPGRHTSTMISGLPRFAKVQILDESGRLIRTLSELDGNGGTPWDGKNEEGREVAGGIYFVRASAGNRSEAFCKIAVVR